MLQVTFEALKFTFKPAEGYGYKSFPVFSTAIFMMFCKYVFEINNKLNI